MAFQPADYTEFRYASFDFDRSTCTATWGFELASADGAQAEAFSETVTLTPPTSGATVDWQRVESTLVLLGSVISLSYYKAAAPSRYIVDVDGMTDAAVRYLAVVLREGLGEFAYRAGLPAPLEPEIVRRGAPGAAYDTAVELGGQPLVPIGGGKDSVVSVESLVAAGFSPVQFAVNPNSIITRVAEVSGLPIVSARRILDRHLLELNADGALNGHVPVTAMNSLIAVAQSLVLELGPVVMSNESSASDPTLDWNGDPVNHQWSKSLDAERLLVGVLEAQSGIAGAYFSLLRPFSELRIARGFATSEKYDAAIVSCNRAFRLDAANAHWCGDCDKCRFVFLAMAPYMSKSRLTGIFGKNMLDDVAQLPGFRALLGLDEHKPFECVGEEAECTVAMSLASRSDDWASSAVITKLLVEIPDLAEGDPQLETTVLSLSEADELTGGYEKARYALV